MSWTVVVNCRIGGGEFLSKDEILPHKSLVKFKQKDGRWSCRVINRVSRTSNCLDPEISLRSLRKDTSLKFAAYLLLP